MSMLSLSLSSECNQFNNTYDLSFLGEYRNNEPDDTVESIPYTPSFENSDRKISIPQWKSKHIKED